MGSSRRETLRLLLLLLLLLLLALLPAPLSRAAEGGPTAAAASAAGRITLDGRLNEPAWQQAPPLTLTQQAPRPGAPTPYETTVRIVAAGDRLYIGFLCRDPEPNRIAVHSMRRDDPMEGDDTVAVALDPYGDQRTGYFFKVNAAGARVDGLIADPEHPSLDWDGVWDARAVLLADGWSAEIEIPTRSLSFTPGLAAWGLQLERAVARDRVTLRWASPTLDSFFYDLSRAGTLTGVEELQQGRGLELSPYLIGRMRDLFERAPRAWQGAGGFDFTWKVTPQIVTVFTANTDFAETEVDSRQINTTRFPLFFPEKRSFFLEGANQYEFGLNLGNAFIPFFSRRIGLLGGRQIPINAGLKLNGRAGRWNLALLDVQTRESTLAPTVNLLAGRVSYDVTSQFRVGTLFTHGDPEGRRANGLVGWDAIWRTSRFRGNKNLLAGAWTALSAGDLPAGGRAGWGFKVDYPNDLFDCLYNMNTFGEALQPALGFLPRPGTRQYQTGCNFQPRPSRDGRFAWIRQFFFENRYARVVNARGVVESWRYNMSPLTVSLESGDGFGLVWTPQYEFLAAPFEIVPGLRIAPGAYRFDRYQAALSTSLHRPWGFDSSTTWGSFYSGRLTQWENSVRWTSPRGRVQTKLGAAQNFGNLREGRFVQRLWQLQTAFAWNPNIVLSSFLQYDTDSQNLGANTRLRWTFKPGNDLFVVWNRGWQRLYTRPEELLLAPESELLAVKLRWTFRP